MAFGAKEGKGFVEVSLQGIINTMNRGRTSLILFFVICALLVSAPIKIYAVSPSSINVDIAPINPNPGENTTITLSSYATNLDTVNISWFVNGKKTSADTGMKSFSIVAPSAGTETTVRAVVSMTDGDIEKKIVIRPSTLVLLWQAIDSYVPPFYKGKALPTPDSQIKVVAMPEAKNKTGLVNPKNLIYTWKKNYSNDATSSGYGKNALTFVNDYLEDLDTISVNAATTDGQYSSNASINITASDPKISFYKNDPALGILWNQALHNGHKIQGDEIIVGEPYFISPKNLTSNNLIWNWFINNNLTNNTLNYRKNWLPIKIEGGVTGTSNIGLQIENQAELLGNVSNSINVEF